MGSKTQLKNLLYRLPVAGKILQEYFTYKKNASFPPGHFYSPIVDVEQLKKDRMRIWPEKVDDAIEGVDLHQKEQVALLENFATYYAEMPFPEEKSPATRYYLSNEYYSYTDGIILYSVMRHFKPARIVEVGSGFSSALMLDVNQKFLGGKTALTFIEPYPERLNSLLKENDRRNVDIRAVEIQTVAPSFFEKLEANDIFFVDSSHVSKTGSDLNYILFRIIPNLKKGVLIHFHDIFYPFEYPAEWALDGRNWNEAYLLRAFLMNNKDYRIVFFTSYMHRFFEEEMKRALPLTVKNRGAGIWIQKC